MGSGALVVVVDVVVVVDADVVFEVEGGGLASRREEEGFLLERFEVGGVRVYFVVIRVCEGDVSFVDRSGRGKWGGRDGLGRWKA